MDDNLEWDLRGYFAKGDVEEEEENRGRSFRLGISREKNENRKGALSIRTDKLNTRGGSDNHVAKSDRQERGVRMADGDFRKVGF